MLRAVLLVSSISLVPNMDHILTYTFSYVDIAFADSHTLWAQHSSGTFSQLDLRQSYKQIDSIPRTSVTWRAGGGLAFVSARKSQWEVPYDDVYAVPWRFSGLLLME